MVRLTLTDSGNLFLDASSADEATTDKLKDLLFYLDYIDGPTPRTWLIGHASRVLELYPFVVESTKEHGIDLDVESSIKDLYERFSSEKSAIDALERRATAGRAAEMQDLPNRELLSHQELAVSHLLGLQNAADFSVSGSGKTTVALFLLHNCRESGNVAKLMVIGPASCFVPWEEEWTNCFGSEPRSLRLVGSPASRSETPRRIRDIEMLMCTYQMAYRETDLLIELLKTYNWMVVLDESHNIKRYEGGAWAEAILRIAPFASKRMILSGTPAPRSLEDLWTQFTFLWPSQALLGSRAVFESFLNEGGMESMSEKLKPFFHRTRKQDLGLPNPIVNTEVIASSSWPPIQRKIIRILETRTMNELRTLDFSLRDLDVISRWRRARIIRLLQAASNPGLLSTRTIELGDPGPSLARDADLEDLVSGYHSKETSGKVSFALEKARELVSQRKKVIIWTWFVGNIRLLEKLLEEFDPLTAYGAIKPFEEEEDTTADESRERNIREFRKNPHHSVLIANPSACSESISLHRECHHAIYIERTFNCGQFIQSMDRIHRVGLPPGETATYHIPILDCAIDRLVDSRLVNRQHVMLRVLSDNALPVGGLGESGLLENEYDLDAVFEDLRQMLSSERSASGHETAH